MALAPAVISMNLKDLVGDTFDARRVKVYASTNIPTDTVIDTAGNEIRLGTGSSTVDAQGNATLTVLVPGAGSNPASWQTYVHVDYPDKARQERVQRTFGPFTITGDANLADLISEQEVPPDYLSQVTGALGGYVDDAQVARDQAIAARDAAVDVSNIATPDALVKTLVQTPTSATAVALSASIATVTDPLEEQVAAFPAAFVPSVRPVLLTSPDIHVRPYDPRLNVYNLRPEHLRRTRAKLGAAAAGTALCNITCVGHSIVAGAGAEPSTQAWPIVMRNVLEASGVPVAGTGQVLPRPGATGPDVRWFFNGDNWPLWDIGGRMTLFAYNNTNNPSTISFTSDRPGTVVEFRWFDAGASFTITVDGGTPQAVTGTNTQAVITTQITGLSNAVHTVVINRTAGTLYAGAVCVRRTTGLLVNNLGQGSAATDSFELSGSPVAAKTYVAAQNPELVALMCLTNDAAGSVPKATAKARVLGMVQAWQAAGSDVLLIADPPGTGLSLQPYRDLLYEIADQADVPLLDIYDRWGSYAEANAMNQFADGLHPNAGGYQDIGRATAALL